MRRPSAERLYYGLSFGLRMPTWVVMAVYLVRTLHLSPLELVLMGTAMEAAVFLFEVPTGVVADTYSRRLSLIVGYLGMGTAWLAVALVSAPWIVIVLWALWGISYTFTSGAEQAWLADEAGPERASGIFLRAARFGQAGAVVGLLIQVAVGAASLRAGVLLGGVFTIACGLACITLMEEHGFQRRPREERHTPLREMRATAVAGARYTRAAPVIVLLVAVGVFAGMSSEGFDRLKEAHFLRDVGLPAVGHLSPVVWFGVFYLVGMAVGFSGTTYLIRRFERDGSATIAAALLGLVVFELAAMILFAAAWSAWAAIAALLGVFLARDLADPLYTIWLNEQITDSSVRATVFSITGQADAIGQAAGGPVIGAIGNVWGIRAALLAGATALAPAAALFARAIGRHGREPELDELPQPAS
ncbi:MAG TPA: MFS transporter [Gaiellaceae bacterium]|nr:MFS transporter [Gaiellaceae bacterium]